MTLIRLQQVMAASGLSRTSIHRMEAASPPRFPRRRRIGERAVAWDLDEINAWLASRPAADLVCNDAPRTATVRP